MPETPPPMYCSAEPQTKHNMRRLTNIAQSNVSLTSGCHDQTHLFNIYQSSVYRGSITLSFLADIETVLSFAPLKRIPYFFIVQCACFWVDIRMTMRYKRVEP